MVTKTESEITDTSEISAAVIDLESLDETRPYMFTADGQPVQLKLIDEKAMCDGLDDMDARFTVFEVLADEVKKIDEKIAKSKVDKQLPSRVRKAVPSSGSNVATIEIHMRQVFSHIVGRRNHKKKAEITGLYAFGSNVNKLVQGYQKECPYAAWVLWQIEREIIQLRELIKQYQSQSVDMIKAENLGIDYEPFTSSNPTIEELRFNAVHAHQIASVLKQYDSLLRGVFPYYRNHFIDSEQWEKYRNVFGTRIRRIFLKPSIWFYVGKEACSKKNEVYLAASTRMGEIPNAFLTGEQKPQWV